MESEKFNPDATCGFRMNESYFEDAIVNKLYHLSWQQFTIFAPEFIELKIFLINLLYKSSSRSSKSPIIAYLSKHNNNGSASSPIPEITHENLFEFQRDIRQLARKIDYGKVPSSEIKNLICANPGLITDPVISLVYILAMEQVRLGERKLLSAFTPVKDDFLEKKVPNSIFLFLYWGVEGLLESLDRITNSPDKDKLADRIVKTRFMEELFFKLLISHPPIKKIALQQTWIILQNYGYDVSPNHIPKKINANPLRKELLTKEEFKKMHTAYKQLSSYENLRDFLNKNDKRLNNWNYLHSVSSSV